MVVAFVATLSSPRHRTHCGPVDVGCVSRGPATLKAWGGHQAMAGRLCFLSVGQKARQSQGAQGKSRGASCQIRRSMVRFEVNHIVSLDFSQRDKSFPPRMTSCRLSRFENKIVRLKPNCKWIHRKIAILEDNWSCRFLLSVLLCLY